MLSAVKNTCFCLPHTSRLLTTKYKNSKINVYLELWCIKFCHDFFPKYAFCSHGGKKHSKIPQRYLDSTKALNIYFFARNHYGMMTEVNQTLKLEDTPKINNRNFDGGTTAILNKCQIRELFFVTVNSLKMYLRAPKKIKQILMNLYWLRHKQDLGRSGGKLKN